MIIGIIGGSGSGKTFVTDFLEREYNAFIIHADIIGHDLLKKGGKSYADVLQSFGDEILDSSGEINRSILGNIVFNDNNKRILLNSITRPKITEEIEKSIAAVQAENRNRLIVIDAEGIIEADMADIFDEIWCVVASIELRRKRLIENRHYTDEKIQAIINSQHSDEYYIKHSDLTIHNNNSIKEIKAQISEWFNNLEEIYEKEN